MEPASRRFIFFAMLTAFAGLSYGGPPEYIFGTYTRLTPTCGWGGPGGADQPVRDCTGVYQDALEVAPDISLDKSSPDAVHVSFGLHFDIGQNHFCTFRGQGTWVNGRVELDQSNEPLNPAKTDTTCRLTLSISKGVVRLSDPGQRCSASLCIGPGKLNGISYKKEGKQTK